MVMKSRNKISMMRRRLLALLAVFGGGLLTNRNVAASKQRELPLHEADYYKPHDLAG
jgi:hypothetical protein